MRNPAQSNPSGSKTAASLDSTERGLTSSSLHAQGGSKVTPPSSYKPAVTPVVEKTGAGGDKPAGGARIEVKTAQDAKMVAEKRKQSLAERKLDKCPVCGEIHTYERTWTAASPPVKARLVSTHLTTCAKFLSMSPDEKMAVVMGNVACMVCAAWDHATHKFPGGKPGREIKCSQTVNGVVCGAPHGTLVSRDCDSRVLPLRGRLSIQPGARAIRGVPGSHTSPKQPVQSRNRQWDDYD